MASDGALRPFFTFYGGKWRAAPLLEPIPQKGAQGLWGLSESMKDQLRSAISDYRRYKEDLASDSPSKA